MIVPVTVTGSVVLAPCFVLFEPGWANASGASSAQQIRMATGFFIYTSVLMLRIMIGFPLQRDSGGRAARNLDFFRR
jgi:hypothetical protein